MGFSELTRLVVLVLSIDREFQVVLLLLLLVVLLLLLLVVLWSLLLVVLPLPTIKKAVKIENINWIVTGLIGNSCISIVGDSGF